MNHKPHHLTTLCHTERSLAESKTKRQGESKDPEPVESVTDDARSFRVAVRFIDDRGSCESPSPFGFAEGRLQRRISDEGEDMLGPGAPIKPAIKQ